MNKTKCFVGFGKNIIIMITPLNGLSQMTTDTFAWIEGKINILAPIK